MVVETLKLDVDVDQSAIQIFQGHRTRIVTAFAERQIS